jgi:Tol biopolymer transport system component
MRLAAVCLSGLVLATPAGAGPGNGPILFLARAPESPVTAPAYLYSVRADGSQRTQVTQLVPVGPVLSPDGTKIAFFLTDGGSPRDLYVMNSDGTAPRLLRSYPEYENSGTGLRDVTWSPDGTKLAYLLPQLVSGEQLRIADVATGTDVRVVPDGIPKAQLSWSPDGSEIAFVSFGQTSSVGIYAKNVTTGAIRIIVPTAGASWPRWSPDGTQIAYVAGSVWVAGREGGPGREISRPLTSPPYTTAPLWSPDGKTIYFNQAVFIGAPFFRGIPTLQTAVFSVRADGSEQRQLAPRVMPISWSPEGDALVVGGRDGVFFARPDARCLTFVSEGTFVGWRPGGNPPPPFECVDLVATVEAPTLAGRVGVRFTIHVVNEGTRPASAHLTQRFDKPATFLSYDKRTCSVASATLTCELGTLAPDGVRELSVDARAARGLLSSRVDVTTSARDSDPTSNTVSTYVRMSRCWLLGRDGQPDVLRGTARDELICGLSGDDTLYGEGGRDTLDGGYGADTLIPGPGRDVVLASYGDDNVFARDGARDTIDCGRGNDTVQADRFDVISRNCEHISRR